MNEHAKLAERLRMANPVPDPAEPPIDAIGADVVLLEIQQAAQRASRSAVLIDGVSELPIGAVVVLSGGQLQTCDRVG